MQNDLPMAYYLLSTELGEIEETGKTHCCCGTGLTESKLGPLIQRALEFRILADIMYIHLCVYYI